MRTRSEYERMLGGVLPHVETNAIYLATKHNISAIGGYRSAGSVPGSFHPLRRAVDYMVYSDKAKGDRLAADVLANWDEYNVIELIWYRRYWSSPTKSVPYVGPSPHTDHPHVSYSATPKGSGVGGKDGNKYLLPGNESDNGENTITDAIDSIGGVVDAVKGLINVIEFISDPVNWQRIALAVGGGLLLLFGLLSVLRGPQVLDLRKVIK